MRNHFLTSFEKFRRVCPLVGNIGNAGPCSRCYRGYNVRILTEHGVFPCPADPEEKETALRLNPATGQKKSTFDRDW
jgi:hypothetical protein